MYEHLMYPEDAFQPRGGKSCSMRLHGGKGGSAAPAPDPRLIEAQIRSMGYQDDAIQKIMANSARLAPLQEEELRTGLQRGAVLYGQSQEDRGYSLERRGVLSGLQNRLVTAASEFDTAGRREQLAGQAMGDVTRAFESTRHEGARGLQRMGIDPSSGRSLALRSGVDMAEAAAKASAANKTRQAARLEGYQLTDRATNAMSGYPAATSSSVGAGLSTASFGLQQANGGLAGMNSGYGMAGTMAGQMGQGATGMYGAQASYKSASDKQASDDDPFKTILGAAAGGLASSVKWSDRRLKTAVRRIGSTDDGVPIYTYRYLCGGGLQVGVMADEVAAVHPGAVIRMSNGYDAVDYSKL